VIVSALFLKRATSYVFGLGLTLALMRSVVAGHVARAEGSAGGSFQTERSVWVGVYSDEQAKRGATAYRESCARCHLENLKGSDMAPALLGDVFINQWDSKTVRAFYGRILSTMPADDPGNLDEKAVLDIVAYLLQANGYPPGSTAIENAEQAQWITITRNK
jgi:mono/diheme cytochrome c family protein